MVLQLGGIVEISGQTPTLDHHRCLEDRLIFQDVPKLHTEVSSGCYIVYDVYTKSHSAGTKPPDVNRLGQPSEGNPYNYDYYYR
jgi:hypothetical protein